MTSMVRGGFHLQAPPSPDGSDSDSSSRRGLGGSARADVDEKRKRKLELNRIASRESRKRKKRRLEELQRSVLYLTHENHQLREQNELLRQMLVGRLPHLAAAQGHLTPEQQQQLLAAQQQVGGLELPPDVPQAQGLPHALDTGKLPAGLEAAEGSMPQHSGYHTPHTPPGEEGLRG